MSAPLKITAPIPIFQGFISWDDDRVGIVFTAAENGPLRIYKQPIPGHLYVIGLDGAEGRRLDYTDMVVIDCETLEVVAYFHSNTTPPEAAAVICHLLGLHYNVALLVIERNPPGPQILGVLDRGTGRHSELPALPPYPNIYQQESFDEKTRTISKHMGFLTTGRTKKDYISRVAEYFNRGQISIYSRTLLEQMSGFSQNMETMKFEQNHIDPSSGLPNDDGVVALGLGFWVAIDLPQDTGKYTLRRETW